MIELENVSLFTPQGRQLLNNVEFVIPEGKITLLKGGNGLGKTQLMKNILGLESDFNGEIKNKIIEYSYLPQVENVSLTIPLSLGEISHHFGEIFPLELKERPWNRASGGERKRCLISRTFEQKKKFIVLDEPLNHLDKDTQEHVTNEIVKHCQQGCTILMTGHIDSDLPEEFLNIVELEQWRC